MNGSNANIMETPSIISMNWLLKEYRSTPIFETNAKIVEEPMTEIYLLLKRLNILEKD
jgi:hypothetical protein